MACPYPVGGWGKHMRESYPDGYAWQVQKDARSAGIAVLFLFFINTYSMTTYLLLLLAGIVSGFIIGYALLALRHSKALEQARADGILQGRNEVQTAMANLSSQLAAMRTERDLGRKYAEEERLKHEQQQREARDDFERRMAELKAEQNTRVLDMKEQQEKQLREQTERLKAELLNVTQRMLEQRSQQLKTASGEQFDASRKELERILGPLNENLRNMREQVEKARTEQIEKMAHLDSTIRATLQQADSVKASADKLANALTAENKVQGNFGELRLRTLLENMGFKEGVEFEEQYLLRDDTGTPVTHDETGQKLIPDTIIHFPAGRDIIIDSKMSLKAYADYANATDDAERKAALKRHVESVKHHVDELSEKKYYRFITGNRESVDFVVMFIPYDNMLEHALAADPQLWQYAARRNVLITGSHNLYMLLRIAQMSWERMRQTENTQQIIREANIIVQRVQDFYTRMQLVDRKLEETRKAFDQLNVTLSPSGRGIITAARKLLKCGAKEDETNLTKRKRLPKTEEELQDDDPTPNLSGSQGGLLENDAE